MRASLGAWLMTAVLGLAACSTADPYREGSPSPARDLDCSEKIDMGAVRIPVGPGQPRKSREDLLRDMGYDGWTDVRPIAELYTDGQGRLRRRLVAWEGLAWRYADLACRIRR